MSCACVVLFKSLNLQKGKQVWKSPVVKVTELRSWDLNPGVPDPRVCPTHISTLQVIRDKVELFQRNFYWETYKADKSKAHGMEGKRGQDGGSSLKVSRAHLKLPGL